MSEVGVRASVLWSVSATHFRPESLFDLCPQFDQVLFENIRSPVNFCLRSASSISAIAN